MHSLESENLASAVEPWWQRHPRMLGLLVGGPCWLVVAVAVGLHPDPRGYDTHTQLHLPACGFMQSTGMPCPTCGMTTAFAAMAHGRVFTALHAQSFGAVLFVATALAGVLGAVQATTGRGVLQRLPVRTWWLWAAFAGMLAGWAIKMAVGMIGGRLPIW